MRWPCRRLLLLLLLLWAAPWALWAQDEGQPFDLLIAGGQVYDGTGNPWFYADVGIRAGRVVAVGALDGHPARNVLDATGKAVVPGFIDLHSHADDGAQRLSGLRHENARMRAAPNLVMQGITTVVVNQDGRSPWPIRQQRAQIEQMGIGPNAVLLVGHSTIRSRVMGTDFRRAATSAEVQQMRVLVRQAMQEGASGLSAGLEYSPARWSTTDEVVALAEEIVPFGGFYIAHQRSEGADPMWYWPSQDPPGAPTLIDAVLETIEVGERTGATVVATHLKAKGAHYWGTSHTVVQLIEQARARGVSVWGDQYPYNTSGTDGNTVLLPGWVFEGRGDQDYTTMLRHALQDSTTAARLRHDVAHEIRRRGGAGNIVVLDHPDAAFVGETLGGLAAAQGVAAVEMAFRLQDQGSPARPGGGRLRGFSMAEQDVEAYAAQPWMATTSDAGIALPEGPPVHPRFYGTFPRKLHRYALERGTISLSHAIRSATSLPAQILGFRDRGQIREGFHADIAVIDLERLRDRATVFEPHQYAEGVDHVLVGGAFVVKDGALTWALPGQVLSTPRQPPRRTDD